MTPTWLPSSVLVVDLRAATGTETTRSWTDGDLAWAIRAVGWDGDPCHT